MSESNIKLFSPDLESVSEFLERFQVQNYKDMIKYKDEPQSKAMLLANSLPTDVLTDIQRRLKPKRLTEATYADLEKQLVSLYTTNKSIIGASVALLNRKQKQNETIENFAKSLNELASQCEYETCCRERILRDIFVSGLINPKIIGNLIHEAKVKTFHNMIEKAKTIEQLNIDVADMKPLNKTYSQNMIKKSLFLHILEQEKN